jgi:hypothetical protein
MYGRYRKKISDWQQKIKKLMPILEISCSRLVLAAYKYIIIKPSQKVMSQRSKISQSVPLPAIPTTADHNPQLAPLSKPSTALSATTSNVASSAKAKKEPERAPSILQLVTLLETAISSPSITIYYSALLTSSVIEIIEHL